MKKYLIALIPFVVCSIISVVFYFSEPKDYPDPSYPYRTQEYMIYFTNRWFWFGIILSGLFLIIILFEDIPKRIDKYLRDKRFKKGIY